MTSPNECIRGIPNEDCHHTLVEGSYVASTSLFSFHKSRCRCDGWIEESINWMDDEHAKEITLNQKKEDGQLQFKMGIAIIPRTELDRVRKKYGGLLDYERRPIQENLDQGATANPYHGNVLLKGDTASSLKSQIRALLADRAEIRLRKDQ